jgi:hypothetical protein
LVEDILRSALGTQSCQALLRDVLREEGTGAGSAAELPLARRQIFQIAKPVLQDELISRVATILAHR